MKTKIIVLFLIVLSTPWCANVLAHMDGEIKRHFSPCTNNDPSVAKGQDKQDCIDNGYLGGHGHVDETHDGTAGGDASSWGYWDPCGYAVVSGGNLANCNSGDSDNNGGTNRNNRNDRNHGDNGNGEGNGGGGSDDNGNGEGNGGGGSDDNGHSEGNGGGGTSTFSISLIGPSSGAPGDTLTFTAEVQEDGTASPGQAVTFTVNPNDGNATLGTPNPATTENNGQAQITLTLGNSASGSYTITATSNSLSDTVTVTVTTSPPPPTVYSIHVISGPGSGAPGDTLTFVVEVRANGAASSNQSVVFSITSGDGNATLGTPNPATTANDGQAQITITLGNNASGSYAITATSQGQSVSGTATVTTSPPSTVYSIHVISGPGSGAPGDTLTFVVEVRANGAASSNQSVVFSITSGDGNATLGTPNPATTANDGQAQITITLGNNASGSYAITATSQGQSVSGTATVTGGGNNGNNGNNENNENNRNNRNNGNNGNNGDNGNKENNGNNGNNGNSGNDGNNGGGNNQQPDTLQRGASTSDQGPRYTFQLYLYAGWNFVHIPLEVTHVDGKPRSIETVGDLFQILMPAQMIIHDGKHWLDVFEDSTQALGPNQGVAVYMDAPLTVNLVGWPLPTGFSLEPGLTFVGIPRQSPSLQKVSDFLTFYPKVYAVLVTSEGKFYLVGRAGDAGDVAITGGQAFAFIATEQYTTNFSGAAWGKVLSE